MEDLLPAGVVAGLREERGKHGRKQTCASLHVRHGTPPKVLSTMLGHASVAITLDRYGHLYPGDVHLYVDRLGEVALAARADYVRTAPDPVRQETSRNGEG